MSLSSGESVLNQFPHKGDDPKKFPGGNSGAVISPAPKLGYSSYQDPQINFNALPFTEGDKNE